MKHLPSYGPSLKHMDHSNPGSFNTDVALIFPFLCAEGEGDVPPSADVNTQLRCGVMIPGFSSAYCDEDSRLPGQQPKKQSTGSSLEGESTEQSATPPYDSSPDDTENSPALKGESWTQHATILGFLPHSSVVMITGEGVHLNINPCP